MSLWEAYRRWVLNEDSLTILTPVILYALRVDEKHDSVAGRYQNEKYPIVLIICIRGTEVHHGTRKYSKASDSYRKQTIISWIFFLPRSFVMPEQD